MSIVSENPDAKIVNVKIPKEMHAALRVRSFMSGISMQDMFLEFIRAVVLGEKTALSYLERVAQRRLEQRIRRAGIKRMKGDSQTRGHFNKAVGVLDHDTLYSLIGDVVEAVRDSEGDDTNT